MSDVSRLIRERALAILRDTRSRIDPNLLRAMKEHISAAMPQVETGKTVDQDMPLSRKSAASERKFIPPSMDEEDVQSPQVATSETVDKQKIAKIVVEYMKHRENGSKH